MIAVRCLVFSLGIAVLFQAGCGSSSVRLKNDLKVTGMAYHTYHDAHQKGPPNWDELIAFAKTANLSPEALQRARDAKYELKWGVKFSELKEGTSNTVMGEAPGGGPKIMMDGSVR